MAKKTGKELSAWGGGAAARPAGGGATPGGAAKVPVRRLMQRAVEALAAEGADRERLLMDPEWRATEAGQTAAVVALIEATGEKGRKELLSKYLKWADKEAGDDEGLDDLHGDELIVELVSQHREDTGTFQALLSAALTDEVLRPALIGVITRTAAVDLGLRLAIEEGCGVMLPSVVETRAAVIENMAEAGDVPDEFEPGMMDPEEDLFAGNGRGGER